MIQPSRQVCVGVLPGLCGCWLLGAALATAAQGLPPLTVEPSELTSKPERVGSEVVVEDRIARIQFHPGRDFDQIYLKRAPSVTFELPERLRFKRSPHAPAARLRGILRREGSRWWVDVTSVELLPADIDRLNSAVATLPRVEFAKRLSWARWAESRAEAFQDEPLRERARQIEVEVLRDEAERPGPDPASHWLALADRARARGIAEPEPSALSHRGFRAMLGRAKTVEELEALTQRIERTFPEASRPSGPAGGAGKARWQEAYDRAPDATYRGLAEPERRALDRRLWADAVAKRIEGQAAAAPDESLALAEEVSRRIPERVDLADRLFRQAIDRALGHPSGLRSETVERLARVARERLGDPDRATALLREWLFSQRRALQGTRDAEGRLLLAAQFERMLGDEESALDLLREASAVEPDSPQVAEAYILRGYRKSDGRWVKGVAAAVTTGEPGPDVALAAAEPTSGRGEPAAVAPAAPADRLLGATPEQVRARMGGRPNRRVVVATQGQLVEQWIYSDAREYRYVSFLRRPGDSRPRVVAYYSLPRGPGVEGSVGN